MRTGYSGQRGLDHRHDASADRLGEIGPGGDDGGQVDVGSDGKT
jgi:hypothetical protein